MNVEDNHGGHVPDLPLPPPFFTLDDIYQKAFLGHDVSADHPPRAAYSLPLLAKIESHRLVGSKQEDVEASVAALVIEITERHGDKGPIFIDDAVSREKKEKSRIIKPGGR